MLSHLLTSLWIIVQHGLNFKYMPSTSQPTNAIHFKRVDKIEKETSIKGTEFFTDDNDGICAAMVNRDG